MKFFRINTIAFKIQTVENLSVDFSIDFFVRIQLFSTSTSSRDMARPEDYATLFFFQSSFFSFSSNLSFVSKDFFRDFRFSPFQILTRMLSPQKQFWIQTFSIQKFRILQFQISLRRFRESIQSTIQFINVQIVSFFNFDCVCSAFPMELNTE